MLFQQRPTTKRQRLECPPSWLECDSLLTVPSAAAAAAAAAPATSFVDLDDDDNDDNSLCGRSKRTTQWIYTPLASETTKEIFLDRFHKEVILKYCHHLHPQHLVPNVNASAKAKPKAKEKAKAKAQQLQPPLAAASAALSPPISAPPPPQRLPLKHLCVLLRDRMVIGFNECTKVLEDALKKDIQQSVMVTAHQPLDNSEKTTTLQGNQSLPVLLVLTVPTTTTDNGLTSTSSTNPSSKLWSHFPVLAQQLKVPILLLPGSSTRTQLGRLLGIRSASVVLFLSSNPNRVSSCSSNCISMNSNSIGYVHKSTIYDDDLDSFIRFICGKIVA